MKLPAPQSRRPASISSVVLLWLLGGPGAHPAAQQIINTYWESQIASGFGIETEWIGDIDGDGYGDLIVGASNYANQNTGAGKAYVLSGLSGAEIYTYEGTSWQYGMGWDVAGVGDVDGDGVPDFAAGTLPPGLQGGDTWVWSGSDGSVLFYLQGFGDTVAGVGDLDADGLGEILVGNPTSWPPQAAVFSGGFFTQLYILSYLQSNPNASFGNEVAGVGDVDGDGVPDLAVGATMPPGTCITGYARLFSGTDGSVLDTFSGSPGDDFGRALAGPGDVNGDGLGDLVVGAPTACPVVSLLCHCGGTTGQVYLYDGDTGDTVWQSNFSGPPIWGAGLSVAGPGDVDGDGVADVLFYHTWGEVRLLSGATRTPIYDIPAPSPMTTNFGISIAPAEDVDGDDVPDFLVGVLSIMAWELSRVQLYSGAPIGTGTFGSACPTAAGILPRIGATGSPAIGTTLALNLSQVDPGLPAMLFLGTSNTIWSGVPLPLDLGIAGMPGCDLNVSIDATIPAVTTQVGPGQGAASFPLAIPNNPALIGLSLYAQWLIVNPPGSQTLGATTRGLQLTFQ